MVVFLLIVELLFFLWGVFYLYKREKAYAYYFGALYLYSTPALIGYYYFPSLSMRLNAYFGDQYWYSFFFFIFLSMIAFFCFSLIYINKLKSHRLRKRLFQFVDHGHLTSIGLLIILFCCGIQILNMIVNFEYIGYQQSTKTNALTTISALLFQISVGTIIILYYIIRSKKYNYGMYVLLIVVFVTFLVYGVLLGNRHVLLQIVLGISYIEIELKKLNKKTFIIYLGLLIVVLFLFQSLRVSRSNGALETGFNLEYLLWNDYYPPTHVLFTAIKYNYVDTLQVISSNFANSFIGLGVDYLQKDIMELIVSFSVTRDSSYAFYVFTEGYMFMGYWGFLYNGFILSTLMYLWKRISNVEDKEYSIILTAILVCYSIDLVRGQTSYFIRYLWLYLLPNMLIYSLLRGARKFGNE